MAGRLGLSTSNSAALAAREHATHTRYVCRYRTGRPLPRVEGRDIVLVDDGLATGVTAEAALRALGRRRPRRLLLTVPVCSAETAQRLSRISDGVVCVFAPDTLYAVGCWYSDFSQTTDGEVVELLQRSRSLPAGG